MTDALDPAALWAYRWSLERDRCERDFLYLASNYLRIKSKDVIGFPTLKLNAVQKIIHEAAERQLKDEGFIRLCCGKCRQVGSCLDADTRILTTDLRWVRLGDVQVGDSLVGVDEWPTAGRGGQRKLRRCVVEAAWQVREPAYRIVLEDGRVLIASGAHRFLAKRDVGDAAVRKAWRTVEEMAREPHRGYALRAVTSPWKEGDYDDGWFGGVVDGEGSLCWRRRTNVLSVCQNPGDVWERMLEYAKIRGYGFGVGIDAKVTSRGPLHRLRFSRMAELFQLIGQTRPSRFVSLPWWEGKAISYTNVWSRITAIDFIGLHKLVDLQTSIKTFVAEGFVSHNSTYWQARAIHQTAFHSNRNALMVAHDEPSAIELFSVTKGYYDALPTELRPKTRYDAKQRMIFEGRNSKILSAHAANTNVAAGQMLHIVHMTEAARYGDHADLVQASLFPTISEARGDDYSTVVIESTSVYGGDWFKDFAEAAQRGENGYRFLFIPAFKHHAYTAPVPDDVEWTHEERELLRKHAGEGLTKGFLIWRRQQIQKFRSNPLLVSQEYPVSFEDSWKLPKGALRVFDDAILTALRHGVRPPRFRATPLSSGLEPQLGGPVEVWEAPQEGVFYDIGIDISEGRTESSDWTVACVIRRDTLEQVAQLRLHINPASVEFIDLIYWLGMNYNTAQLNPDITGGWGNALLTELQMRSYPNIWRWRRRDDAKQRISSRLGFLFTKRDKATLVSNGVALASRGDVAIHSEVLCDEMATYLNIGIDEWSASTGYHDDAVIAWLLALLASYDERASSAPYEALVQQPTTTKKPWAVHDVDADLDVEGSTPLVNMKPWEG